MDYFNENIKKGGAINYYCVSDDCFFNVTNNTFINNSAEYGAGIYYSR